MSISAKPSILIILMGSLGDVARGLALVSHLKTRLPGCRITWLVEPKCADLVSLHPQIDHIIVFKRKRSVGAMWALFQALGKEHFDITLDLQRHLKSGFFSLLSRGKRRIGFHRKNAKEFNWLFNNECIPYYNENLPKLNHYFKFTEHLGLADAAYVNFGFTNWNARQHLPPKLVNIYNPLIAIVLGSRWDSKNWFTVGYIQLVRHILEQGAFRVILVGDASQQATATEILEKIKSNAMINLVGKTSLLELIAILKTATTAVGPDSGPGHLAAAVGTPYVTLFGPTPANRHAPYGCEHLIVESDLHCAPCYQKNCPETHRRCMENLNVDDITAKIDRALGENTQRR